MDTPTLAWGSSKPQLLYRLHIHCPNVQMAPPDKKASRQSLATGEGGEAFSTRRLYSFFVGNFTGRSPFLFSVSVTVLKRFMPKNAGKPRGNSKRPAASRSRPFQTYTQNGFVVYS